MSFRIGCTSFFISATLNDGVGDQRRHREKPSIHSSRYQRALRLNEMEDVRLGAKVKSLERQHSVNFERLREDKTEVRQLLRNIRSRKCHIQCKGEKNTTSFGYGIVKAKKPADIGTSRGNGPRVKAGFQSFRRNAHLRHVQCLKSTDFKEASPQTCQKHKTEKGQKYQQSTTAQKHLSQLQLNDKTTQKLNPAKLSADVFFGLHGEKKKEASNTGWLACCLPPLPVTQLGFSDPEVGSISPPESPLPLRGRQAKNAQGMTRIMIAEAMSWNQRRWKFRASQK